MVVGRSIEAKRLAEFLFRRRQLLLLEQSRAESMVSGIGIGIERDRKAQLAHAFFQFVIQQQGFAEDAVFGGTGGILQNCQLQFWMALP